MTAAKHPSAAEIAAFLRAELPRPREAALRLHFEGGCVLCLRARGQVTITAHEEGRERLGLALASPEAGDAIGALNSIGQRLARLAWLELQEERAGEALLLELLRLPRSEQVESVRSDGRYQLLGFSRYLSKRARSEVQADVEISKHLGQLAVEAADALDERAYLPGAVAEAGVAAWGAFANALRVATDLPGAERALLIARQRLRCVRGEQSRLDFLSLVGSLRIAQAKFGGARAALDQARELAQRLGEQEIEARIVLKLAKAHGEGGNPAGAVELLDASAGLFQQDPGQKLALFARHARAMLLLDAGQPWEARQDLEAIEAAWLATVTAFADRQRLFWLRARVAWAEGDLEGAERELLATRDAFGSEECYYDYALVCLDLAVLYLEQGRLAEVCRLAEEMHPVFASRQLHSHALAALALFQVAAGAERATVEWVRGLTRYLRHSRTNPYLRFEPDGGRASVPAGLAEDRSL